MRTCALLVAVLVAGCNAVPQPPKEVPTVVDAETGVTVWHDDRNSVTCWIGHSAYTLVCMPDHWLRAGSLPVLATEARSAVKRVAEEAANEAARIATETTR